MQSCQRYLLPVLALAALSPQAWAQPEKSEEKKIIIRRLDRDGPQAVDREVEKEKVAFLGVETAPVNRTLSAQLGLPRETGLIVTRVAPDSPATAVLKEDDILVKFEDQILVNMPQLGTLVRSKKEGDEVKLTVIRGGKETTVKAKLAVRELPRMAQAEFFPGAPGAFNWSGSMNDLDQLRNLPGIGPDHARDVLRLMGRERGNVLSSPRIHIRAHRDQGSTILDLPKSDISYSDDDGAIEIKSKDDKRVLIVKDAAGKTLFEGPCGTEEERKNLPPEVAKRLEKLNIETFNFEAGEDFKTEVVPMPPSSTKSKIRHELGRDPSRVSRPF